MQHPPAPRARRAFASARKSLGSGDYGRAAGELEKAIRISPEYADAYHDLAVLHIRAGHYEQAIGELRQAIHMGGPRAKALSNLSYAQARLQRRFEAIASAREALKVDPAYAPAHFMLGSMLAADLLTVREAISHLERAAESMPAARKILEMVRRDSNIGIAAPALPAR